MFLNIRIRANHTLRIADVEHIQVCFTETKQSCKLNIENPRVTFASITVIIQGTEGTVHKPCKLGDTEPSSHRCKMSAYPKKLPAIERSLMQLCHLVREMY